MKEKNTIRSILISFIVLSMMMDVLNSLPHPMPPIVNGEIADKSEENKKKARRMKKNK